MDITPLQKSLIGKTFTKTAVLKDGLYKHFGATPIFSSMYGCQPEDIVEVKLKVADDQSRSKGIASDVSKKPDYWGWFDIASRNLFVVHEKYFLLQMCFPAAIADMEATGKGLALRLEIVVDKK